MIDLTDDECLMMMEEREVPESVRSRAPRVAVVLTQSWCPDWALMRGYLRKLEEPGLLVLSVEYDRRPFFRDFMRFKEEVFANSQVPYVRYYRDGRLVATSNLVFSREAFLAEFGA